MSEDIDRDPTRIESPTPSPTMHAKTRTAHLSLAQALAEGPPPPGNLAVPLFAHGSLTAELYSPKGSDPQKPHLRDEIYVIARGSGLFFDGTGRMSVELGTFLFVAAGQEHRFESFTEDFAVWVFFYGPPGGEAPRSPAPRE